MSPINIHSGQTKWTFVFVITWKELSHQPDCRHWLLNDSSIIEVWFFSNKCWHPISFNCSHYLNVMQQKSSTMGICARAKWDCAAQRIISWVCTRLILLWWHRSQIFPCTKFLLCVCVYQILNNNDYYPVLLLKTSGRPRRRFLKILFFCVNQHEMNSGQNQASRKKSKFAIACWCDYITN